MRSLRRAVIVIFLVMGFYLVTTSRYRPAILRDAHWVTRPATLELTQAAGPERLDAEEQNNAEVYRRVVPAVVNVTSKSMAYDFFYGAVPQEGQGSGFIIDKEGHIITNFHVIQGAQQVEVSLHNKKRYTAAVVGFDRRQDLAVLQISAKDLPTVTLGDSRNLTVGQKVFAIGNPFGLSGTMSRGIISSIRPVDEPEGGRIDSAIQTDAAINPGNSGGPLLNSRGEVIGINTMIATGGAQQSSGIGFAIPINTAKAALNDLVSIGHVRRPWLAISRPLSISPELAQEIGLPADFGLLVQRVVPNGSAEKAGLKGGNQRAYLGLTPILLGGDLIVAIDGKEVQDQRDLDEIMDQHRAGDTVTVTIYRARKKMDVKVTLGEAPNQS